MELESRHHHHFLLVVILTQISFPYQKFEVLLPEAAFLLDCGTGISSSMPFSSSVVDFLPLDSMK